ncbi:hypothetical protein BuS5_02484 [Desulfosarcina sp. BuS5]|uniref:hypothetical protein n=1 Tax=Desulfosarcina sp. BuS5 TaxID=933262 RepID=UPI00047F310E|nr:hypothetical protein [Desulfosarcina sp. BuS5]WDN89516.1 hypothetical protein BuS5_02484 [Desulfosarcina sp. BuS5]
MKTIFKTILFLIMVATLNSCAGLSGAVKPQEPDRLNSVVPEAFHFNIHDKTIRNYLAETEPDRFPPNCQSERRLEIILLAGLAEAKDEEDLARVFDNLWQKHEKIRELINNPQQRADLVRPTAEIYYLLSAIPGADWRHETAGRIYTETLKDINPEQLSGYALHFYTLALLKNGKSNTALPFLLRLKGFAEPAAYLKDLSIALSFAIEGKDYSTAVKIMEQVCRFDLQNNLKFPDQQMYDAVKAMKASGKLSLAQIALAPLIKENPGLETFQFAKLLSKKAVFVNKQKHAAQKKIIIKAQVIEAGQDSKHIDIKLTGAVESLKKTLNYSSFKLISEKTFYLHTGQTGKMPLLKGSRLKITPQKITSKTAVIEIFITQESKEIFNTVIETINKGAAIIGGPKTGSKIILIRLVTDILL